MDYFRSTRARQKEVKGFIFPCVQLHERTEVYRFGGIKTAQRERAKFGNRLLQFRGLAGLAAREIRSFEPPGIVLVLGFALFVRGFSVGSASRFGINVQLTQQVRYDGFEKRLFIHDDKMELS